MKYQDGDKVLFRPERGTVRRGTVKFDFEHRRGFYLVQLQSDPYSVYISEKQIERESDMPTETTKKKATKRKARGAGRHTSGPTTRSEDVEVPEVPAKAPAARKTSATKRPVKKATVARKTVAKKTTATKAPAKKVAASRAKPGPKVADKPVDNPFRPGSNSHHYTEALKKGGKRSSIVRALLKKIDVHPWNDDAYADPHMEVDKRLTMIVKQLETKFGFHVERRGRGADSFVKITPPSEAPKKARATKKTSRKAA